MTSFLDILYLGRIFPRRASIMAKRELLYAPLLGQYRQYHLPTIHSTQISSATIRTRD